MARKIEAIYQNGVLRLLDPVDLAENQRVRVSIDLSTNGATEEEWLDVEYMLACASENDDSVSLESVRDGLSKIPGSLTEEFIAEREDR